ncbi:MAG: ABC transporter ATP-binding protein [Alicyclobacillus sp.]|nr:ABC transporter ATP-binding protein [Alicyclobacillus sp.]
MPAAIEMHHVTKMFRDKRAVDDLNLTIDQGTVVALLGPNGAGKSTTISMMLGLRRPTSGRVLLLGKDPTVPAHRRHIGAMLQQVSVPDKLKVIELVNLFRSYYPAPLPTKRLLELAGLENEAKREASRLSGGQKRRLQFALAMSGDPQVLFLDEPTTGMDVQSRRGFWESLRTFARTQGKTVILTTHHLEEADAIADRIVVMQHGRSIADASPKDLKAQTGYRYVSFRVEGDVEESAFQQLPGVVGVEWSGRKVRLRTTDSDAVLRQLVLDDYPVCDFEVSFGGLEDAFIALTEESTDQEVSRHAPVFGSM